MSLHFQTSLVPQTLHHRRNGVVKPFTPVVLSLKPDPSKPDPPKPKPKSTTRRQKPEAPKKPAPSPGFPTPIPRKPRRGRRSEAKAVEDYIRDRLEQTFAAMEDQNPELFQNRERILKERAVDEDEDGGADGEAKEAEMVVEEDCQEWPADAEVGWGIRASEYFEKHPIRNVVGEDGSEIDWEGEIDDNWVKEINCLEWENFAFHPSPLVVLVFERYNRASENWNTLKELEKAVKVYRHAKDRLPPRTVKMDINIERDMAYALNVKEGPQLLFLRGNRILYREKEFRTADELVQMIAHFYYKAKRPSWIDISALSRPYY